MVASIFHILYHLMVHISLKIKIFVINGAHWVDQSKEAVGSLISLIEPAAPVVLTLLPTQYMLLLVIIKICQRDLLNANWIVKNVFIAIHSE